MALVINDRVKVTSTTTGTGAVALGAAQTGFESFADGIGNNNTTYYTIFNQGTAEFEVGLGTLDGTSANLTRTTVISSSNSDNAVNFSAGNKDVFRFRRKHSKCRRRGLCCSNGNRVINKRKIIWHKILHQVQVN
jgi:hypothetical protein